MGNQNMRDKRRKEEYLRLRREGVIGENYKPNLGINEETDDLVLDLESEESQAQIRRR